MSCKDIKISILPFYLSENLDQIENKDIFKQRVKVIKEIGYNGLELALRDPELVNIDEFRSILEENMIPVSAIGTGKAYGIDKLSFTSPDGGIRKEAVRRIKKHIDFSSKIGGPPVIIGLIRGRIVDGIKKHVAETWLISALKECAAYAGEKGISIALEPINRYETNLVNDVDNAIELLEYVQYENIGFLLDTFHMNIEEYSIEQSIQKANGKILHFHIADSNRWAPGYGHLNFKTILESLYKSNYDRYLSGEIFYFDDPVASARKTYEFIKSVHERLLE